MGKRSKIHVHRELALAENCWARRRSLAVRCDLILSLLIREQELRTAMPPRTFGDHTGYARRLKISQISGQSVICEVRALGMTCLAGRDSTRGFPNALL